MPVPMSFEEAVDQSALGLLGGEEIPADELLLLLDVELEEMIDAWAQRKSTPVLERLTLIGAWCLAQMNGDIDHVKETVIAKQHDYGHKNILRFDLMGVIVRMSDKIARLQNLVGKASPKNEAIKDSWLDLVGYSLIGLMLLRGTFKLPLKGDA